MSSELHRIFRGFQRSRKAGHIEGPARTEIYAIPSLTISDRQFLTGDANGKEVTVAGEFRIEAGVAAA